MQSTGLRRTFGFLICVAIAGVGEVDSVMADGHGDGYDWSGFYLGGHIGGISADLNGRSFGGVGGTVSPTPRGILGGVLGGYNYQISNLVFGVEADVSFAQANDLDSGAFVSPFEGQFQHSYSLRGRLGYGLDRTLLYATAGAIWAQASVDSQSPGTRDKQTHFGVQVGAGVEHALSQNLIVRAEYLFGGFDRERYTVLAGGPSDNYGLESQVARAAAIWKFGGGNNSSNSVAGFGSAPDGYSWTGFYLGAHAGVLASDMASGTYAGVAGGPNPSPTGFAGGVLGGYNHQVRDIVFGIEADASFARATDLDSGGVPLWFEGDVRSKYSVRGRVGYAMGGALLFATGGPAWASASVDEQNAGVRDKNTHFGFEVGGGLELALTRNIVVRGEYLYGNFGKEGYVIAAPGAPADSYDLETHTARFAAIWKFGQQGDPGESSVGFAAENERTDWTGFYIGAHAGGLAGDLTSNSYGGAPTTVSPTPTGITGGVLAGYNHQVDRFLVGVEGDATFSAANDIDGSGLGLWFEGDIRETYSLRARAGYVIDQTMLFASAGPAWARAGVDEQSLGIKEKNEHFGFQIGGGVEHALNESLLIRGEYLYSAFGKESYTVVAGGPSDSYDLDIHAARLALIWNFGTAFNK